MSNKIIKRVSVHQKKSNAKKRPKNLIMKISVPKKTMKNHDNKKTDGAIKIVRIHVAAKASASKIRKALHINKKATIFVRNLIKKKS